MGEVCVNNRETIRPFLTPIANKLCDLCKGDSLNKSLAVNVAITFGRLGLVDPRNLALNHLEKIVKQWCIAMRTLKNGFEKDTSFRGLISMIPFNPVPIIKFFPHLCSAFVQYKEDGASEDLLK